MSKFYDNSIVPEELKRNYDVYDRIKELGIDLGTYEDNVNDITSGGLPIATVLFINQVLFTYLVKVVVKNK